MTLARHALRVFIALLLLATGVAKLLNKRVLESAGPKALPIHFLRDVSREDSAKAWAHCIEANRSAPCWMARRLEAHLLPHPMLPERLPERLPQGPML